MDVSGEARMRKETVWIERNELGEQSSGRWLFVSSVLNSLCVLLFANALNNKSILVHYTYPLLYIVRHHRTTHTTDKQTADRQTDAISDLTDKQYNDGQTQ